MAETSSAKAPSGPKVSGTRTAVSLVFLVIVLVISVIELRAGLGQFLTLRSFNKVSENSLFENVSLAEAQEMVAAFPSRSEVQVGDSEDVHHYYWYSLLRPLMGKPAPEMYVSSDHSVPPRAVSFYTSTEGEDEQSPDDSSATSATMPPAGSMRPEMMAPPGGSKSRPPLEDAQTDADTKNPVAANPSGTEDEPAPTEPAPAEPAPAEPDPAEPTPAEPASAEPDPAEPDPAEPDPATETPVEPN